MLKLSDLTDPGSARLPIEGDAFGHGVCVVQKDGQVYAYLNRCPHTGGPMDWVEGRFLSMEGDVILCSTHGARFRIEDGLCLVGPCAGQSLSTVPVVVDNDDIKLAVEDD